MGQYFPDKAREEFFTHLFNRYYPIMKRQARAIMYDSALEDDAIQDAFVRLLDKYDVLEQMAERQLIFYITQAVKWSVMDILRVRGIDCRTIESLDSAEKNYYPDNISVTDFCEKIEISSEITAAMKMLPAAIRDLVIYKYVLGHTTKELAVMHQCSEDNIRQKLSRARKYLCKLLKNGGEEHD